MKVISVIEDEIIIKKILKHLGLWEVKPRPSPKATGPQKTVERHIDYSVFQIPVSDKWLYVDSRKSKFLSPYLTSPHTDRAWPSIENKGAASKMGMFANVKNRCQPEVGND